MTMVLRSTPTLTFEQYRFYLNTELLNSNEDTEVVLNDLDINIHFFHHNIWRRSLWNEPIIMLTLERHYQKRGFKQALST